MCIVSRHVRANLNADLAFEISVSNGMPVANWSSKYMYGTVMTLKVLGKSVGGSEGGIQKC